MQYVVQGVQDIYVIFEILTILEKTLYDKFSLKYRNINIPCFFKIV